MKFFNNLSRKLEDFEPINPPKVTIYSCGPTVYDVSHIGHARSAVAWDILYRYLKYKGYKVQWSRNITNVDDKIINRAKELGINPDELSRKYTFEFWADMQALNVSWPSFEPRATDYISQMIKLIEELISKGAAYVVDGDVYFKISSHKNYGQLKGQSPEDLRKGLARVEQNEKKEDQLDFALWKSFPDEHDEHCFESPWGRGRPGWHLECSTMIHSLLGDTIDIHAGGDDLIFPHHENECAQSEMLTGHPLAKFWMHNGMIMIEGKKMSKSDNNYLTIKDILNGTNANAIRYFILTTHYKKQLNFTHEALKAAETGFETLYKSLADALGKELLKDIFDAKRGMTHIELGGSATNENLFEIDGLDRDLLAKFEEAMDNDLATPQALAMMFEAKSDNNKAKTIKCLLEVLGFDLVNHKVGSFNNGSANGALSSAMEALLEIREKSRANKDFATSDLIRDKLSSSGIVIKDNKGQASTWELH